ncbi:hypothetical protein HMN09_00199300 [Mycena chlorophos]|uniref:Uncharacterized protein n=1 Tax=Mycena chlorophos TaxID=658473 RepID=A0A8H6TSU4_MYCCL|nr:hypothetical protein HMN09_00199300 [Mycena chlorophos]
MPPTLAIKGCSLGWPMPSSRPHFTMPSTAAQQISSRRRPSCAPRKLECARTCTAQKIRRAPLATKTDANGARPGPSKLRLPLTLPHPVREEVNLAPSHPHLANVPPQYVRDNLPFSGMSASLAGLPVKPILHTTHLPETIHLEATDAVSAFPPTHILAVYDDAPSPAGTNVRRAVSLVPVHDIVFAAHCSRFPTLPTSASTSTPTTIPVVPLRVPSLETFSTLHAYLYTQDASVLRAALTTPCKAEAEGDLLRLAAHAQKIHGLWRNSCVLGLVDTDGRAFAVIEEAWGQVVGAMKSCRV